MLYQLSYTPISFEKMFYTSIYLSLDPRIFDMLTNFIYNVLNVFFPYTLTHCNFI